MRRALVVVTAVLLVTPPVGGQVPGELTFRITQKGEPIGDARVTLARSDDGWTVTGSSTVGGSVGLDVRRFEFVYDEAWRGRSFSIELARPGRTVIAHAIVARPGARTRTDIVLEREVRPAFNHVSPHAVFLPDYVLPAFVALPPRLAGGGPFTQIPVFVPLRTQLMLMIDGVDRGSVETASGPVAATHWRLRLDDGLPVRIDLWEHDGQLLRVELPGEGLAMARL